MKQLGIKKRLRYMANHRLIPFDLDFLREIGFEFGLDWDGQLVIERPQNIDIEQLIKLIVQFSEAIKIRLKFEGQKAKRIFVGGPLNGKPYSYAEPNNPIYYHIKRGEWLVYMVKNHDDPRAWYVGKASSKKKAKLLIKSPRGD